MTAPGEPPAETYHPWNVVNLVFYHLADQGLHPTLGEFGDPGEPAAALLRALGIQPATEGHTQVMAAVRRQLEQLRDTGPGADPAEPHTR